jgi:hypothetical protein
MFDTLEKIIIVKVFSHQLNADFSIKHPGQPPSPNLFITSANQFADNAVQQARELITNIPANFDQVFYPEFSPRWCFTVNGQVTNQGATKILQQKVDDKIFLRLQHREK